MSRSDANSAGSVSNSVGTPIESTIWDLFTCVADGSDQFIQKHIRKLRSCSACLEDGEYFSLDKAYNTLRVASQHKSSMDTCHSFCKRSINKDRLDRRTKVKSHAGKSNLRKHTKMQILSVSPY